MQYVNYFLSHHPNPAPAYGRICFFTFHLSTGPCPAYSAGLNQALNQSRPIRGGGNPLRNEGAVPRSAPRWPRLNSPAIVCVGSGTARVGHKARLSVVPDGIRFETGKLLPARGQRPGAPGRSIEDSGSQCSFLGLAYIGRLDRQSILMKSTAHVRAFNKPQVNPCTNFWYTDLPAMFMLGQKPIKRYIHYFNARA